MVSDPLHCSSKGVQLGGLKSEAGFLGQWCTVPNDDGIGMPAP